MEVIPDIVAVIVMKKTKHCRFCGEEKMHPKLYDWSEDDEVINNYMKIVEFLKLEYFDINDKFLPTTTCEQCYDSFNTAYNFLSKLKQSQVLLKTIYNSEMTSELLQPAMKSENIFSVTVAEGEEKELAAWLKSGSVVTEPEKIQCNSGGTCVTTKHSIETDHKQTNRQEIDFGVGRNSRDKLLTAPVTHPKILNFYLSDNETNMDSMSFNDLTDHKKINFDIDEESINSIDNKSNSKNTCIVPEQNHNEIHIQWCAKSANMVALDREIVVTEPRELLNKTEGTCATIAHTTKQDHKQTHRQEISDSPTEIDVDQNSSDKILDNETNITDHTVKAFLSENKVSIVSTDVTTDNRSNASVDVEGMDSVVNKSWASYIWKCCHCKDEFKNMAELRIHSKLTHDKCHAFNCMDCNDQFNVFNSFIEHVREHRNALRNNCQHCDQKFADHKACEEHTFTHWSGTQKICFLCGEIFPDAESLSHHNKLYKSFRLPKKMYKRHPKVIVPDKSYDGVSSWANYQWTCQECCIQVPDVQSLRVHAREFHNKCFTMKCMDCLRVERHFSVFVKHVRRHRPYLQNFCQYCNQYFTDMSDNEKHEADHLSGPESCDGCGEVFDNHSLFMQHLRKYDPPRLKGNAASEDKTCDICGILYVNLRAHRLTHSKNRPKRELCFICGKSYYRKCIKAHNKTHITKHAIHTCKMCNKVFSSNISLRAHLKTHLNIKKLFICNECGKEFKRKQGLVIHVKRHMYKSKIKCLVCGKRFYTKISLKTHMNTHSAGSPYYCTHCEKTFNSWGNCNKHMKRKHGDTLAKTKMTAQGRLDIDKETGKVVKLVPAEELKEWINEIMTMKTPKQE